jgi:thioredoxin reductase
MNIDTYDVICIGAGPTGLACAIEAKRAGMRPLVIDKGCLCNSLYHYPTNMNFFTTPERMEIGDLPMESRSASASASMSSRETMAPSLFTPAPIPAQTNITLARS